MRRSDAAAPESLRVIGNIVENFLGRLDQPKRGHVPDKLSSFDRDPGAIQASAQV
jgi:hypothetical protein